ncbi:hypothetical protein DB459_00670 [Bradyrhizobium sp. WD16]|nr:hypothetical protein DB459_00670 [Bradyrhizobium sp. WD16]
MRVQDTAGLVVEVVAELVTPMLNGRMLMMPSLFASATFATRSEVLSNSIALASRFVTRMTSGLRGASLL